MQKERTININNYFKIEKGTKSETGLYCTGIQLLYGCVQCTVPVRLHAVQYFLPRYTALKGYYYLRGHEKTHLALVGKTVRHDPNLRS